MKSRSRTAQVVAAPREEQISVAREPRILYSMRDLPPIEADRVRGRRILVLLANEGHAIQETLLPAVRWEEAGAHVDFVALDGGDVQFDVVCNVIAQLERLWSPVAELAWEAERTGRFKGLRSLRDEGSTPERLRRFALQYDAVAVPGGHGDVLASFLKEPVLHDLIRLMLDAGRVVAPICHAVAVLAYAKDDQGRPLGAGRHVTCWPHALEVPLGRLPLLGTYFQPLGDTVQEVVAGASRFVHAHALPWKMPVAVIDGNLVTSWGPWTAPMFGEAVLHALAASTSVANEAAGQMKEAASC